MILHVTKNGSEAQGVWWRKEQGVLLDALETPKPVQLPTLRLKI
jgi:hypothetical protein